MIKVAVLSCYRLLNASLSQIVCNDDNMELVGVSEDIKFTPEKIVTSNCDVLLMEANAAGVDHFAVMRSLLLKAPNLKVLILYSQSTDILPTQFLEAGAMGFLCRKSDVNEVKQAIVDVFNNKKYLSKHYLQELGERQINGGNQSYSSLSRREMQILLLITSGIKVGSICDKLDLSPKTVNTYRYRIFNKLGLDNDVSLVKWAIREGLVEA